MKNKNKQRVMAQTKGGFEFKAWRNVKTGEIVPTNWKLQSGFLAQSKKK